MPTPDRAPGLLGSVGSDFDLLCIGSGPAGQRAAVQAAKLGMRAAIVEKGQTLGGVCVDRGTIPSKTFREAVLAFARPNARGRVGDEDARPTAEQLFARVNDVVRRECDVIHDQLRRNIRRDGRSTGYCHTWACARDAECSGKSVTYFCPTIHTGDAPDGSHPPAGDG